MRDWHGMWGIVLLALAALAVTGCSGDGAGPASEASPDQPDVAGAPTPAGAGQPTLPGEDAGEGDGDAGGGPGAARSGDFAELASQGFAATARVTYEMTRPEAIAADDQVQELVLSSDGERTAWMARDSRMIMRGGGTRVLCGAAGQQSRCVRTTSPDPHELTSMPTPPFMGLATSLQEGLRTLPGLSDIDEREVSGRTARCATFEGGRLGWGQPAGAATLCVDAETGVMLSYDALDGPVSLTGTDFGQPRDSDFEPPAEPRPLDDMAQPAPQGS